jgi:hypothetical protein
MFNTLEWIFGKDSWLNEIIDGFLGLAVWMQFGCFDVGISVLES